MNQLLKQRIAQLKNGEIPIRYKKTEFGIFPCDWEIVSIGSVSTNRGEYGLNAPARTKTDGLPKYIRITDIDENGNYVDNGACVDYSDTNGQYTLKPGDIVFARTGASVGRNYLYKIKDGDLVFAGFLIKFSVDEKVSNPYIVYTNCNTKTYHDWVKKISARSGQPGINAEEYCTYKFCKPKSLSEQAKIAEILMTWDKAIELYKKQIEKLKQFKKICLKKMFPAKGQTVPEWRFKGFTGEWERQRIDDLIKKGGSGGTPSTSHPEYYSGTIPFLSIADISNSNGNIFNTEKHITEEAVCASSAWIVPSGSISLAMYASVGKVAILKDNVATSQAFFNMILSKDSTRDYLYYYLKKMDEFGEWTPYISTGTQGNLNSETVRNLCVSIPKETAERRIIGNILNHIDSCIALYQRKLEAEQKRRKALQQYLLNGIVRV